MRTIIVATGVAAALSIGGVRTATAADLIVNGSFAHPNIGSAYRTFSNGSVPGWTVNQDGIEIDYTPSLGLPCYNSVCQSAEVNANTFDTLMQTVTGLRPGKKYRLSWAYGNRPGSGPQELQVRFGKNFVTTDHANGTAPGTWTANSFVVTATGATETLSFIAINTTAAGGVPSLGNDIAAVSLTAIP